MIRVWHRSGLSRECQIQFWCKPLECGIVTGKLLIRTLTRMLSMIDLFKGRHFDREVTINLRPVVSSVQAKLSRSFGPYDDHALDSALRS